MQIRIDPHTLERAQERGATAQEIEDVIRNGHDVPAKYGRKAREIVFSYQAERQGRHYQHKKIQVVFVQDDAVVTTVTVYVFYGYWEDGQS